MAITSGNSFSIFSLLDTLRRRKLFVIIPALVISASFVLYAYTQPIMYKAQTLLAAEHLTPPDYLKTVAPQPLNMQDHLWTVRELLNSPQVLEGAAREIQAYKDVQGSLPPAALEAVKAGIDLRIEGEHTFFITYAGTDKYETMNVTNRLAQLFVQHDSLQRETRAKETSEVINAQISDLNKRLEEQDQLMKQYKQQAVNELPEHVDANIRALDALQSQYSEATRQISDEQARRTSILREIAELESHGVQDTTVVPEKSPAEVHLDELRIQFKNLQARYTPIHPEVVRMKKEISDLEAVVANAPKKAQSEPSVSYLRWVQLKADLDGITQRLESYGHEQQALSAQMASYRQRIASAPAHEGKLAEMARTFHVGESQFHMLQDKELDAKLAQGLERADGGIAFSIIEAAKLPDTPPQRERIILMGLCAGLGLGLVIGFVIEQNDTTFSNVDDFQGFTTLPLVGVIPTVAAAAKGGLSNSNNAVVTDTDPDSVAAEQYRMLAMKVQQQHSSRGSLAVMITSAAGSEGKSLTATNLSVALAAIADGPVLLVDADMRKPRVHAYLGLTVAPDRGFLSLLQNPDDDLSKYVMHIKNIDVIPANTSSTNPVVALSSPKARQLFDRLKEKYKYIIVDAPPTLPIADSHILSGLSDKVLFVVRARRTPRELFQHSVESFDSTNLLGVVLNDVDYDRSRYAYAYQYYKKSA